MKPFLLFSSIRSVVLLCLLMAMKYAVGFPLRPSARMMRNTPQIDGITKHRSSLSAWNEGSDLKRNALLSSVLFVMPRNTAAVSVATTGSVIASALMLDDPAVEAHVLSDVAHVGLDLAVFMGQSVLALRLLAVLGRLCAMGADYLPDHSITPEELVFQLVMLALSCWGLLRAAFLPSAAAAASNIMIRDGKAFRWLFAPTGLTWNHYKAMTAVGAIDWITLKHEDKVVFDDEEDRHVYWLYDGQMELQSRTQNASSSLARHELPPRLVISRTKRDTANAPAALLAEHRLLDSSSHITSPQKTPTAALVTSEKATFLRLNVSRLKRFITDNDPVAAEAMRVLLLQGMDAKLEAHWSRMAQL